MSTYRPYRQYNDIQVSNLGASCTVFPREKNTYYIQGLSTREHMIRRGYASALISRLKKFADKRGLRLLLQAGPYGHRSIPNKSDLISFYEKNGFRLMLQSNDLMEYVPCSNS